MTITNKDIEKLKEVFATKDDLRQLRDEVIASKSEMVTSQDKIMKKLEDISLEQKLAFTQYKRQAEKLDNHENRITALEVRV